MFQRIIKPLSIFNKHIISFIILFNAYSTAHADFSDEVKLYIENIKSMAVEFRQSDSSNQVANGMLVIDKPFKFRCNYYEPFPLLIVGNKNYVSIYDYEMENLSRIKAEENIFNFLLVDNIEFDKKFEVLSANNQGQKYVVKLRHLEMDKISEISFDKKSKQIKEIRIFEENNIITLSFAEPKMMSGVDKNLFLLQNPNVFGAPARLNKKQLQKKLRD